MTELLPEIKVSFEQLSVSMPDANELEAKIALNITGIVFEEFEKELVTDIHILEPDKAARRNRPAMVVHMVSGEDTLWKIGKKYNMPVSRIREMNAMTSDEVKAGDKLLLVKERE